VISDNRTTASVNAPTRISMMNPLPHSDKPDNRHAATTAPM
jgi:hypothetical protein